jgi:hypothetical protein
MTVGVEIPERVREEWAAEVASDEALAAAKVEQEREAAQARAREQLAAVKSLYMTARAMVEQLTPQYVETLRDCAKYRIEYEAAWVNAASLDAQDLREEPLAVGDVYREILSLGGRL